MIIHFPRFDSQDVWIFHSTNSIEENQEKAFSFEFGKPGCDNKIIYLMKILGYEIYNEKTTEYILIFIIFIRISIIIIIVIHYFIL